jgi:hypothetical protein
MSLKENNWFFVTDQTPRPFPTRSHPAQLWHQCTEWSTVWVLSKPLITEENWPGQGLNPGLPNDTPALYPLLHELMLLWFCSYEICHMGEACKNKIYVLMSMYDYGRNSWHFHKVCLHFIRLIFNVQQTLLHNWICQKAWSRSKENCIFVVPQNLLF